MVKVVNTNPLCSLTIGLWNLQCCRKVICASVFFHVEEFQMLLVCTACFASCTLCHICNTINVSFGTLFNHKMHMIIQIFLHG
jgi:hypothetical protein